VDDIGLPLSLFFNSDDLQPIPLTPEILIAVGFKDMNGEYCPSFRKEQIEIEIVDNEKYMVRLRWNWEEHGTSLLLSEPKYFHQLQNIFFFTTNQELIYKP
jgi:hypothetical protein